MTFRLEMSLCVQPPSIPSYLGIHHGYLGRIVDFPMLGQQPPGHLAHGTTSQRRSTTSFRNGGASLQAIELFLSFKVDFESLIQLLPAVTSNWG